MKNLYASFSPKTIFTVCCMIAAFWVAPKTMTAQSQITATVSTVDDQGGGQNYCDGVGYITVSGISGGDGSGWVILINGNYDGQWSSDPYTSSSTYSSSSSPSVQIVDEDDYSTGLLNPNNDESSLYYPTIPSPAPICSATPITVTVNYVTPPDYCSDYSTSVINLTFSGGDGSGSYYYIVSYNNQIQNNIGDGTQPQPVYSNTPFSITGLPNVGAGYGYYYIWAWDADQGDNGQSSYYSDPYSGNSSNYNGGNGIEIPNGPDCNPIYPNGNSSYPSQCALCTSINNGSISVYGSGGDGYSTYTWSAIDPSNNVDGSCSSSGPSGCTITGLAGNVTYTISVTDGSGDYGSSGSVYVSVLDFAGCPSTITATPVGAAPSSCGSQQGGISISGLGSGLGGGYDIYIDELPNGSNTPTSSVPQGYCCWSSSSYNLYYAPGNHTITITDAGDTYGSNQDLYSGTVNVPSACTQITASVGTVDDMGGQNYCDGNGNVTVTNASGGDGNGYSVFINGSVDNGSWNGGTFTSAGTFTPSSGAIYVYLTDADDQSDNNMDESTMYSTSIPGPGNCAPVISFFYDGETDNTGCASYPNGQVNAAATGGSSPYTYDLTGSSNGYSSSNTTGQFTGLVGGDTYNLVVYDYYGNTDASATNSWYINNYSTADPSIEIFINGGGTNIEGTSTSACNSSNNSYTASDANSLSYSSYSWSYSYNGASSTSSNPSFTANSAFGGSDGITVDITTSEGCLGSGSSSINVTNCSPGTQITVNGGSTDYSGCNTDDGTVSATPGGGDGNNSGYNVYISGANTGYTSSQNIFDGGTATFGGGGGELLADTYTLTVYDADDDPNYGGNATYANSQGSLVVNAYSGGPTYVAGTDFADNTACSPSYNGMIGGAYYSYSGGTVTITATLTDNSYSTSVQLPGGSYPGGTQFYICPVPAGTYNITITDDACDAPSSSSATIYDFSGCGNLSLSNVSETDNSTCPPYNGSVSGTITGANAPSNASMSVTVTGCSYTTGVNATYVSAGTWTFSVTGLPPCPSGYSISVNDQWVGASNDNSYVCGGTDGLYGTNYSSDNGTGGNSPPVNDVSDCGQPVQITATPSPAGTTCSTDGSISLNVIGGLDAGYQYTLDDGPLSAEFTNSITISGLVSRTYNIRVYDALYAASSWPSPPEDSDYESNFASPLSAVTVSVTVPNNGGACTSSCTPIPIPADAQVISASLAVPCYGESPGPCADPTPSTSDIWVCAGQTYTIYNGCGGPANIYLEQGATFISGNSSSTGSGSGFNVYMKAGSQLVGYVGNYGGLGGGSFNIVADPTAIINGGISSVTYCTGLTFDYSNAPAGGCNSSTPGQIQIITSKTDDPTCIDGNGSITFSAVNGDNSNDYNFTITGPNGYSNPLTNVCSGSSISGLDAGTYNISVTDYSDPGDGLQNTASIIINLGTCGSISPNAVPTALTGCNTGDGQIAVSPTGGDGSGYYNIYLFNSSNVQVGGTQSDVQSYTFTGLTADTYSVSVEDFDYPSDGDATTQTGIVVNNSCGANTWTGGGNDGDWLNDANWSSGHAPVSGCAASISIPTPGGTVQEPVLRAPETIGNLSLSSGASITLSGVNLSVCGDVTGGSGTGDGEILGSGDLVLNGTTQQISDKLEVQTLEVTNGTDVIVATGAGVDIYTALVLNNGIFDASAGNTTVTLKSTSAGTFAFIDNFSGGQSGGTSSGSYLGNVTAERYYNAATNVHDFNQHMLGIPVGSNKLSAIGANGSGQYYIPATTGGGPDNNNCNEFLGATGTPYGNVFHFVESHASSCIQAGWYVDAGSSNVTAGLGYSVILSSGAAGTLAVTGPPNLTSSYSLPTTNSGYPNTTANSGTVYTSGINLLSNPYPASLDVNSLINDNLSNFDHAVYVWDEANANYDVYTSPEGGTIAPFAAFKVITGSPAVQSSANYAVNGTSRTTGAGTFQRTTNPSELTMTVINSGTGLTDQTIVGFNADAINGFDLNYDLVKLPGALTRHTLYSLNSNNWMYRNILTSISQTATVPVGLEPGVSGTYSAAFDGINSFDPTSYITLEDRQAGTMHDARSGAYTFSANATDNFNRFVLHFTPPAVINTTDASCSSQGIINITQPGTANWNYTLMDNNNVVLSSGVLNASSPLIASVPAGTYTLTLKDNNGYNVVKTVQIGGAEPVLAAFNVPASPVGVDEQLMLTCTSGDAAMNNWDFGDGTTATGCSVSHTYVAQGVYNITLTASSTSGCVSSTTSAITVTQSVTGINGINDINNIAIWSNEDRVHIDFSKIADVEATIEIYNVIGQLVTSDKFTLSAVYTKQIDNIDAGYILVRVRNGDQLITKKVFITSNK